ncbi:hypothetical protein ES708_28468 [subsurface metagenome]
MNAGASGAGGELTRLPGQRAGYAAGRQATGGVGPCGPRKVSDRPISLQGLARPCVRTASASLKVLNRRASYEAHP